MIPRTASVADTFERLAPLLVEDPKAAAIAGIPILATLSGAQVGGFLLFRRRKVLDQVWHGPESGLRDEVRDAAVAQVAAAAATDQEVGTGAEGVWRIRIVRGEGDIAVVFALAWPSEDPAFASNPEGTDALAGMLARRWLDRTALQDVRAENAQQANWFNTMDEQLRVLDRERQKFVAVVSQSDTFMFVVDPELKLSWVNRALQRNCEDHGQTVKGADLAAAWTCLEIDAPKAGSESCPVTAAFSDGQLRHAELRSPGEDGNRDLYVTFLPIRGADGLAAEVLVMIQDLSGLDVVRRLQSRYRRLFENSPDGMMMVDPETGRILLANSAAERLTECSADRLVSMSVENLHDPEEWPEAQALYRHVLDRDESMNGEWHLVSTSRRIVVSVTCTRFEIDGRNVTLAQYRDITEQRALENELRHSQKMEAVGSLAGGVAHDFNNLLTVILGKSELLAARVGADSPLGPSLETIRKTAVRGSLLTRQLLAFGRKAVIRTEVLDLNAVVADLLPLLETLMGERKCLTIFESPTPCYVCADRGQLEQVVMNLAVNARDAMLDGGHLRLSISLELGPASRIRENGWRETTRVRAGERVVLEAIDDGCGMSADTVSHVFEPFFTTKGIGEGTGLGLSTVYGIVTKCGGAIDVSSEPGRGTSFRIHFPRECTAAGPPIDSAPAADGDGLPAANISRGSGRVLLAEDEDDLREMASEALQLAGYTVVASASGEEALKAFLAADEPFRLLLTDVVMTGISGGELAQMIREVDPELPVLFMSGYNDDEIVRHGVSRDEASFLQKPFTIDGLARKVNAAIDQGAANVPSRPSA